MCCCTLCLLSAKSSTERYLWLFLGPPRSGKSTLVKQLRRIYCSDLTVDERNAYGPVPVVRWMKTLCEKFEEKTSGRSLSDPPIRRLGRSGMTRKSVRS